MPYSHAVVYPWYATMKMNIKEITMGLTWYHNFGGKKSLKQDAVWYHFILKSIVTYKVKPSLCVHVQKKKKKLVKNNKRKNNKIILS